MGERGAEESTPGERDAWGLPIRGDAPARQMVIDAGFADVTVTFVDWRGAEARLVIGVKRWPATREELACAESRRAHGPERYGPLTSVVVRPGIVGATGVGLPCPRRSVRCSHRVGW